MYLWVDRVVIGVFVGGGVVGLCMDQWYKLWCLYLWVDWWLMYLWVGNVYVGVVMGGRGAGCIY